MGVALKSSPSRSAVSGNPVTAAKGGEAVRPVAPGTVWPLLLLLLATGGGFLSSCQDDPAAPDVIPSPSGRVQVDCNPDTVACPWSLMLPDSTVVTAAGDTLLEAMPCGTYGLTWLELESWLAPSPATVTDSLADGAELIFTGEFVVRPPSGSLEILHYPFELLPAWTLGGPDGLLLESAGDTLLPDLPVGDYYLTIHDLVGWDLQGSRVRTGALLEGRTLTFGLFFSVAPPPETATLRIDTRPDSIDIPWHVEGPDGLVLDGVNDAILKEMVVGTYYFSWGPVHGYVPPFFDFKPFLLQPHINLLFEGFYQEDPGEWSDIVIDPDVALAPWTLTGPDGYRQEGSGDAVLSHFLSGEEFTLAWGEVPDMALPAPPVLTAAVPSGADLVFTGSYIPMIPLPVPGVAVRPGPEIGEVTLSWRSLDASYHPLVEYRTAFSTACPVTAENWNQATPLGTYPHTGNGMEFSAVYSAEGDRLTPGALTWFAVRARDDHGNLSTLEGAHSQLVPVLVPIFGRVTDAAGEPLAGIPVEIGIDGAAVGSTVTAGDGTFRFEPVLNVDLLAVATRAAGIRPGIWYDFTHSPRHWDGIAPADVTLIPRHTIDPVCSNYSGEFLNYLWTMTKTMNPTGNRPDRRLYRWEAFPLQVYVPGHVNQAGIDLAELCRGMTELWNTTMEASLFVLVDEPGAADVVFRFGDDLPTLNGQVSILEPGGGYTVGDVVPARMEVYINRTMNVVQRIQEVALHELGHVLGVADHSLCSEAGYLMYVSSSGVLDHGPENAVHPDERNLIRTILSLPQGTDMGGYRID